MPFPVRSLSVTIMGRSPARDTISAPTLGGEYSSEILVPNAVAMRCNVANEGEALLLSILESILSEHFASPASTFRVIPRTMRVWRSFTPSVAHKWLGLSSDSRRDLSAALEAGRGGRRISFLLIEGSTLQTSATGRTLLHPAADVKAYGLLQGAGTCRYRRWPDLVWLAVYRHQ